MANQDIFNLRRRFDETLGFNPNWDYKSAAKVPQNFMTQRPRFGPWISRSVGDAGVSFNLTFSGRPVEQLYYIRRFYEEHQQGYFTLIDHDDHGSARLDPTDDTQGRHYVGRFTQFSGWQQQQNLQYQIDVMFEELPSAPMIKYPADFGAYGHWMFVVDGFGTQQPFASSPAAGVVGVTAFYPRAAPPVDMTQGLRSSFLFQSPANAGDFFQTEYQGFGFQMEIPNGSTAGVCNVFLDGVQIVTGFDINAGTMTSAVAGVSFLHQVGRGTTVIRATNVSLGRHRVKIVATGANGAAGLGNAIIFPPLQVIH